MSYRVPDSDDEAIMDGDFVVPPKMKQKRVETSLQRWIKELSILLKDEQKKVNHLLYGDDASSIRYYSSKRRRNTSRNLRCPETKSECPRCGSPVPKQAMLMY
jgi:hypothetical protein